jgi:hypothetical protein
LSLLHPSLFKGGAECRPQKYPVKFSPLPERTFETLRGRHAFVILFGSWLSLTLRIEQMTIALLALKWRANDDVSVRRSAIS